MSSTIVVVRAPDPSCIVPRRQCLGDWSWWFTLACTFLKDAQGQLAALAETESLSAAHCCAAAYSVKTASEMLGMTDLSTCAFKMESGALRGADATELELLQLIGIVLDSIATMREVLEGSDVALEPERALEAVDGYFDALVTTLRQSTWGSVSSVRSTGEDDAAGVSGGGGEGAKDDHFVSSGRHRRQSAVGESHPSGRRQRRQSASGVPGSGGGAFAVRRAGAVGASAPVYNSSESLFSSETAGAATPGAGGSVRRSSLSLNYDGSDGGDAAASGGSGGQRGQLPFGGMRRNLSCSSALAATVLPQLMTRTLSAAAAGAVTEPALSTPKSPIACATPPRASYDVASSSNHYQQRKVVGVLGSDDVARAVTAAVVAKSTGADVLLFDSPADLLLGMGVRLDGGGIDCESASVDVVFVCSGPGLRLGGRLADLPLVTVDGVRRRFLFVGEMEEDLETEALMSDVCDVTRLPARTTEIAARLRKSSSATAASFHALQQQQQQQLQAGFPAG